MQTQTPYREVEDHTRLTLDDEERDAIAEASTWMVRAGIVGIVAAALQATALLERFEWPALIYYLGLAAFAFVVLQAGRHISGIRRAAAGQDFQFIERSLRWLAIVFRVKGSLMLGAISIFALIAFVPFLTLFLG
ncbi:MAG: hypothetical protein AAF799_34465 [Myxococcota bacterium]